MMLALLDEIVGLDSFTQKEIANMLIDDMKLYKFPGVDPEAAIKKRIQGSKNSRGEIN